VEKTAETPSNIQVIIQIEDHVFVQNGNSRLTSRMVMNKRSQNRTFAHSSIEDRKGRSVRGGAAAVCSQGTKLLLQMSTTMLLARLLTADDFGLQGMAATLMGFVALFREAGLAAATVQRL